MAMAHYRRLAIISSIVIGGAAVGYGAYDRMRLLPSPSSQAPPSFSTSPSSSVPSLPITLRKPRRGLYERKTFTAAGGEMLVDAYAIQGHREYMEDEFSIVGSFTPSSGENDKATRIMLGCYDGHGGGHASKVAKESLHKHLADTLDLTDSSHRKAFGEAFKRTELEYKQQSKGEIFEGTTSVVALVEMKQNSPKDATATITVANAGDSRCVLCEICNGKITGQPLSFDHKPNRSDELERIQKLGGTVAKRVRYDCPRIYDNRKTGRTGGLAVSRAIGDLFYEDLVPCTPEVSQCTIPLLDSTGSQKTHMLILASDGVWDVMNDNQACAAAANEMSFGVVSEAFARRSMDNITAVVAILPHPHLEVVQE